MTTDDSKSLALFGQQTIRRVWHTDEWYYSIVDVIAVLTESSNPRNYWNMLKARAKSEGFDAAMADIVPLKLKSADNRFRLTETANRATLLRIIQSMRPPSSASASCTERAGTMKRGSRRGFGTIWRATN